MVKNLPVNAGHASSISGLERPLEKEIATPSSILASFLGNPMDRGAWRATVHAVARVKLDLVTKQQRHANTLSNKRRTHILINADGAFTKITHVLRNEINLKTVKRS